MYRGLYMKLLHLIPQRPHKENLSRCGLRLRKGKALVQSHAAMALQRWDGTVGLSSSALLHHQRERLRAQGLQSGCKDPHSPFPVVALGT